MAGGRSTAGQAREEGKRRCAARGWRAGVGGCCATGAGARESARLEASVHDVAETDLT